MCALGAIATAGVWADIWKTAQRHGEVMHIALVPLVALWLVWVRRERLRQCEPVGTWMGPLLVLSGWIGSVIGDALSYEVFAHLGAVAILIGCILSVVGVNVVRRFLPAFVVLLLLIPAPWIVHEHLARPFLRIVGEVGLIAYEAFGVTARLRGEHLVLNGVSVPVVAACGAPGLKAIFLVAFAFAFAKPLRGWVRALVLLSTPVVAVVTQLLGTMLVVYLVPRGPLGFEQLTALSGWLLLPVAFALLVGLIRLLDWAAVPVQDYSLAKEG